MTLAAGGDSVNLDPASTTNKTNIRYNDGAVKISSMTYTTTVITGNTDKLLEPGEMFEIGIDLTAVANTTADISENETFTLEIQAAVRLVHDSPAHDARFGRRDDHQPELAPSARL